MKHDIIAYLHSRKLELTMQLNLSESRYDSIQHDKQLVAYRMKLREEVKKVQDMIKWMEGLDE